MSDLPQSQNGHGQDLVLHSGTPNGASRIVYLEPIQGAATSEEGPNGLLEYWQLVRARKWTIATFVLLGIVASVLISLQETPVYRARMTLEVQSTQSGAAMMGLKDGDAAGGFAPESYLQTQVRVLESRSLRKRVLGQLRKEDAGKGVYVPDRFAAWRALFHLPGTPGVRQHNIPPPRVEPQVRVLENSQIIEVVSDSVDPELAARYANTMGDEYIESTLQARWDSAQRTTEWLSRQLEGLRAKLQHSESQLQAYSQQSGLVFTGDQESVEGEKLKQLQDELSRAQADRIARQSAFEIASSSSVDSIPQVLDDGRLSEYQMKLAELRRELAELRSLYTPSHYKVIRVEAQIQELEATLKRARANVVRRIQNDYQAAVIRERLLSTAYQRQMQEVLSKGQKAIYYGILKREVDTNQKLYDELLQKVKQIGIGSAVQATNTRILDHADVPTLPYTPNPVRDLLMGVASGLLLGLVVVVGREFVNRSLRSPGEASYHLKVPELGVIPSRSSLPAKTAKRLRPALISLRSGSENGKTSQPESLELITWQDRPSLIAESFRSALASILVSKSATSRPHVILVTSAGRGEGKSSVVSNLGIALAEISHKVLLLDADMRKPRLHEIFSVPNSWGLSDLLREKTTLNDSPLEALARPADIENLHILPSGPGTASIANLLYSTRVSELMLRLRKEFDVVLIDTPPMSYLSDARVLGRVADGAILVIRAGKTTRDEAMAAKQRLVDDGIPVLGTILNGWDTKSKGRYGYHSYGYSDYNSTYNPAGT